jgi:transcription-repair coupling factor (superfamily II helicase)
VFDEFCARFPYEETEDQLSTPSATSWRTLGAGKPMDRLICGDVGFGKTEVALRAAFVVAMSGQQVAVVAPTTLLARQHYKTFVRAVRGLADQGATRLSRLVVAKEAAETREALKNGESRSSSAPTRCCPSRSASRTSAW